MILSRRFGKRDVVLLLATDAGLFAVNAQIENQTRSVSVLVPWPRVQAALLAKDAKEMGWQIEVTRSPGSLAAN